MPPLSFLVRTVFSSGTAMPNARPAALPGLDGPRYVEFTARKASIPRSAACFCLVREVAVQDVGGAAEEHLGDAGPLGVVGRAGVHLVQALGQRARLEAAQGPGRRGAPAHHLGHADHDLDAVHLLHVDGGLAEVGVVDQRLDALVDQRHRHHLEVDLGEGVEPELLAHDHRGRQLHRSGDLELVAVEELDGRGHPAGVPLGLETDGAQAGPLQQERGGQAVVAGSDDDGVVRRVVISHDRTVALGRSFVNSDETCRPRPARSRARSAWRG